MKVYVLIHRIPYEGGTVVEVCDSDIVAGELKDKHEAEDKENGVNFIGYYEIEMHELRTA